MAGALFLLLRHAEQLIDNGNLGVVVIDPMTTKGKP